MCELVRVDPREGVEQYELEQLVLAESVRAVCHEPLPQTLAVSAVELVGHAVHLLLSDDTMIPYYR